MTIDYPKFLAARLDEQEFSVRRQLESDPFCDRYESKFALADIEAKRAIIDTYRMRVADEKRITDCSEVALWHGIMAEGHLSDIKRLCRPFANHPDYPGDDNA